MGRIVAIGVVLWMLGAVACAAGVATLPVVKTIEELKKVQPIDIGGGVQVRVGIEAERAPRCSGVLVYCLVKGNQWPQPPGDTKKVVGPLGVDMTRKSFGEVEELVKLARQARRAEEAEWTLFACGVILEGTDEYTVTLWRERGVPLATGRVVAGKELGQAWFGLERPVERQQEVAKAGEPRVVRVSRGTTALPVWDGAAPSLLVRGDEKGDQPLPTFIPTEPALKLTRDGDVWRLHDEAGALADPFDNVLVRWWVNGQPAEPQAGGLRQDVSTRAQEKGVADWVLRVEWNPEWIGAKKGDKVAVQVMYSAGGVEEVRRDGLRMGKMQRPIADTGGRPPVRVSNKVEFVVE